MFMHLIVFLFLSFFVLAETLVVARGAANGRSGVRGARGCGGPPKAWFRGSPCGGSHDRTNRRNRYSERFAISAITVLPRFFPKVALQHFLFVSKQYRQK